MAKRALIVFEQKTQGTKNSLRYFQGLNAHLKYGPKKKELLESDSLRKYSIFTDTKPKIITTQFP